MKYLKLIRVKHYLKNLLLFLPILFGSKLFNLPLLAKTCAAFVIFSFTSSIIYILNDIMDIEKDRLHPVKKQCPLASGAVSRKKALVIAVILFTIIFVLNFLLSGCLILNHWLLIYLILNILYSIKLKNIPILDISILSFGFLIRVLYGASVTGIALSHWLYLTVLSASFYMGIGKRRNEYQQTDQQAREVLRHYNFEFLDKNFYVYFVLTIVFYSLWCIDMREKFQYILLTIPFILLIMTKYNLDIESSSDGDPIATLTSDKILLTASLAFSVLMICILYL